jgi:hypothetical protein
MSKCQVKDCENEAIGFICDHEDGDHDICQECIDKYYPNMVHRYVVNRGWREVPTSTPTVDHKTEHGDIVQVVEEKVYEKI